MNRERKTAWQREQRRAFRDSHGFSTAANYATGGQRGTVLARDQYRCVVCGVTDEQHRARWDRPITIDHKDKDRTNNALSNLQTLCLECHGRKDLIPSLRVAIVPVCKAQILSLRAEGKSYQHIADTTGFSIGAVWKWCQLWKEEV